MLQISKTIRLVLNVSNSFLIKNENNVSQYIKINFVQCRTASIGTSSTDDFLTEEEPKKRKTVKVPRITLINQDQSVRVLFLEEAKKIAKRHNLQLVLVTDNDPKNGRSVYKLLDFHHVIDEDDRIVNLDEEEQKLKATKFFTLKSKIEEHDLQVKIANINKVLKKNHKAKIVISYTSGDYDKVIKTLKKDVEGIVFSEKAETTKTVLVFTPRKKEKNS